MIGYIRIDGWKAGIKFSAAHIIPEYEKCGRLHGHSYAIHAKVYGNPNEKGIIMDFIHLKNSLKEIAEELDHKILIPEKHKGVKVRKMDDYVELINNGKKYLFPKEDCAFLPVSSTSAESLAHYIANRLACKIKEKNITEIEIGLDEGQGQGAWVKRRIEQ